MEHTQEVFQVSERRACRALGQPRSTQRYHGMEANDEEMLTELIITLASQYGRCQSSDVNAPPSFRQHCASNFRQQCATQSADANTKYLEC